MKKRNWTAVSAAIGMVAVLTTPVHAKEHLIEHIQSEQHILFLLGEDGRYTYPQGDSYVGEMKNGKPDGKGVLTYFAGDRYEGTFLNGLPDGTGTYTWKNGDRYKGYLKAGKLSGEGTFYFANGDSYHGQFVNGIVSGPVTFTWKNGDQYYGLLADGLPDGQGIITWNSGSRYIGEFKQGMRNGHGEYISINGEKYVGEFADNLFEGRGIVIKPGGEKTYGDFKLGKLVYSRSAADIGEYAYDSETVMIGGFQNGVPHGEIMLTHTNGLSFVGTTKESDGKLVSRGTVKYPNGLVYMGTFVNGQPDGIGALMTAKSGAGYLLVWKHGQLTQLYQAKDLRPFESNMIGLEAVTKEAAEASGQKQIPAAILAMYNAAPAGGGLLQQRADQYNAKLKAGAPVFEGTASTGELKFSGASSMKELTRTWLAHLAAIQSLADNGAKATE